jgi:hypothetical protein
MRVYVIPIEVVKKQVGLWCCKTYFQSIDTPLALTATPHFLISLSTNSAR